VSESGSPVDTAAIVAALTPVIRETVQAQLRHELTEDNVTIRAKNRELQRDLEALKKQLPPDGALILSPEDAKAFETLKALGAPDEVRQKLEQADTVAKRAADLEFSQLAGHVAELNGWNGAVFARLVKQDGATLTETSTQAEDGSTTKAYTLTLPGGDPIAVGEYAQTHWSDFAPALKQTQKSGGNGTAEPPPAPRAAPVTRSGTKPASVLPPLEEFVRHGRSSGIYG